MVSQGKKKKVFFYFKQQKKTFSFSNLTFLRYFFLCLLLIMVLLHLPIQCHPIVEKHLAVPQRVLEKYHSFISNW